MAVKWSFTIIKKALRVAAPIRHMVFAATAAILIASCNTVADNTIGITGIISICDQGLEGVTLTLSTERYDDITTVTDSDGRYYFNEVPNGLYTVTPELAGHAFIPPIRELTITGDDLPGQDYTASVTWSKSYGRDSDGTIVPSDSKIFSMVQTDECGSVVTGVKNVAPDYEQPNYDLWVMKIDLYGEVQWSETYGGAGYDAGHSIAKTANGGFIIAGESSTDSAGLSDFWAVKIDDAGGLTWEYKYGGPAGNRAVEDDSAEGVIETAPGDYMLCGLTKSYGSGGYEFGWLKLSGDTGSGPTSVAFKPWGYYDRDEFSYALTYTLTGNLHDGFMFAGDQEYIQTIEDDDGTYTVTRKNALAVSLASDLTLERFDKQFQATAPDGITLMPWNELRSIKNTHDGGYICAGWTGTDGLGNMDYWLLKLKSDGDREWELLLDRGLSDRAYTAIQTTDGGYITAGYTCSSVSGGNDFWIVRLNAAGEYEWEQIYNGSEGSIDEARAIEQTWDGGYFFSGNARSVHDGDYIWIMKVDSNGEIPVESPPTEGE